MIGVLAIQGDFAAHGKVLEQLGAAVKWVRTANDLAGLAGLVLPGGESTTMLRLLRAASWESSLAQAVTGPMPTFATCAGLILMAREVQSPAQRSFGAIDVRIRRNGYGRQRESFVAPVSLSARGQAEFEGVFIRAPVILAIGAAVEVLGRCRGEPVLVRQAQRLAATFHPELTADTRLHALFLDMVDRAGYRHPERAPTDPGQPA